MPIDLPKIYKDIAEGLRFDHGPGGHATSGSYELEKFCKTSGWQEPYKQWKAAYDNLRKGAG